MVGHLVLLGLVGVVRLDGDGADLGLGLQLGVVVARGAEHLLQKAVVACMDT